MTRHAKMLLGGVALAAIGLGTAGAIARHGPPGGWGHHGKGHHGGMFGSEMGRMGMFCRGERAAEMTDHMLVRIEHKAKLTDAQKPALEELKTAARNAATKIQAACPATPAATAEPSKDATPPARPSPIERLANAEAMTAATLDAIKTVRPAAEKLYAQLSDEQKAALNERPHGKWGRGSWHRDGRHGGSDRGEGRGPDRGAGSEGGDPDTLP